MEEALRNHPIDERLIDDELTTEQTTFRHIDAVLRKLTGKGLPTRRVPAPGDRTS